jgi:hypothetical protein
MLSTKTGGNLRKNLKTDFFLVTKPQIVVIFFAIFSFHLEAWYKYTIILRATKPKFKALSALYLA